MIPLTVMCYEFTEKAHLIVTVPHCWFFSRQAHLAKRRRTMQLIHSRDPTVTPYIQDIQCLRGQKQLFPMRAGSDRSTKRETIDTDRIYKEIE